MEIYVTPNWCSPEITKDASGADLPFEAEPITTLKACVALLDTDSPCTAPTDVHMVIDDTVCDVVAYDRSSLAATLTSLAPHIVLLEVDASGVYVVCEQMQMLRRLALLLGAIQSLFVSNLVMAHRQSRDTLKQWMGLGMALRSVTEVELSNVYVQSKDDRMDLYASQVALCFVLYRPTLPHRRRLERLRLLNLFLGEMFFDILFTHLGGDDSDPGQAEPLDMLVIHRCTLDSAHLLALEKGLSSHDVAHFVELENHTF